MAGYLLWVEQASARSDLDRENRTARFKAWLSPSDAIHSLSSEIWCFQDKGMTSKTDKLSVSPHQVLKRSGKVQLLSHSHIECLFASAPR